MKLNVLKEKEKRERKKRTRLQTVQLKLAKLERNKRRFLHVTSPASNSVKMKNKIQNKK